MKPTKKWTFALTSTILLGVSMFQHSEIKSEPELRPILAQLLTVAVYHTSLHMRFPIGQEIHTIGLDSNANVLGHTISPEPTLSHITTYFMKSQPRMDPAVIQEIKTRLQKMDLWQVARKYRIDYFDIDHVTVQYPKYLILVSDTDNQGCRRPPPCRIQNRDFAVGFDKPSEPPTVEEKKIMEFLDWAKEKIWPLIMSNVAETRTVETKKSEPRKPKSPAIP